MKLPRFIVQRWPIMIIVFAWTAVVMANYTPHTWLTGWDTLHPEFDFWLNIKRSLAAVWQEYQGVGLLGGMGHAADVPRQIMLWTASLLLPAQLLRWGWTFLMLLAGPLGVYALIHSIHQYRTPIDNNNAAALKLSTAQWAALAGGIFYLFNLATVQVFTAPFDAFVTHYGVLPWLLWSNWMYLHTPSRKILLLVAMISVIGMTQSVIPTLFLVYLIILSIFCVATLIKSFHKTTFTRILALGITTFCINAFWLLPFTYFTLTTSSVTVGAKINQMATQEAYLTNKAFGNIGSVLTLKNFWFDTADYDPDTSTLEPALGYWRNLDSSDWIVWIRYSLAALIVFGGIIALLQKQARVWGTLGIVAIGMVAVDTPPFVWMIDWLRIHIPLFSQFFRFPFTKWGVALALSYSIWLSIGISWMLTRIKTHGSKILRVVVVLVPTTLTIFGSIGILQGHLISQKFKLAIPNEYFQLFTKFKTLRPGRIANLSQNTYWGWTYYRWGYSGSGFLWYGIENPIMDRAFDVWSSESEQYYWELSRALYSKDSIAVGAVLAKYDVRYILFDENIISPSHNRALFTEEIKAMLAVLPEIKEEARFGNLTLYERTESSQSFVSLSSNLPTVSPAYGWTDNDVAFGELGDYVTNEITSPRQSAGSRNDVWTYPFRSLFTKRNVDEKEFTITETPDAITIGSIVEATGASILKADALVYDSTKSADLIAQNVNSCGVLRDGTATAQNIDQYLRFTSRNQRGCLSFGVTDLPHRDGYLVAVESRHVTGRPLLFSLINQTAKHTELETYLQPQRVRPFEATDYFILPPLAADGLGYSAYITNDAIGRQETINDIKSIKIYRIPYDELVHLRSPGGTLQPQGRALSVEKVDHPNPAYYRIRLKTQDVGRTENQTLVLSQSFDPGWIALTKTNTFPFLRRLTDHVLVNNWANGWIIKSQITNLNDQRVQNLNLKTQCPKRPAGYWSLELVISDLFIVGHCDLDIVIFYLPQLLQWLGFALMPFPFLFCASSKKLESCLQMLHDPHPGKRGWAHAFFLPKSA